MKKLLLAILLLLPLTAFARGYHRQPTPPPTPPPVTTGLQIGAFNAQIGTIQAYFADPADLYNEPCNGQTQLWFLEANNEKNSVVASGKYDSQLKSWASKLCAGSIIAFDDEPNIPDNPYGNDPVGFLAAYKHIHALLPQERYAWVMNNSGPVDAYWPGASYVDIVGIDGFQWSKNQTFLQALAPNLSVLQNYATQYGKPLWVTSFGTQWNQAAWLQDALKQAPLQGISALIYFNYNDGGNFKLANINEL